MRESVTFESASTGRLTEDFFITWGIRIGRQQAVVMNHYKNTWNSFTSTLTLTSLRMGILAAQGGLRVEQCNEPGASFLKTHDPNLIPPY